MAQRTIRLAQYNIRNTADRYAEREQLLKQSISGLNADVLCMQEVVFGPKQLDELVGAGGHNPRF